MAIAWFDKSDSLKTVKDNMAGKHTPHSVREAAKQEYRERRREAGVPEDQIREEVYKLSW